MSSRTEFGVRKAGLYNTAMDECFEQSVTLQRDSISRAPLWLLSILFLAGVGLFFADIELAKHPEYSPILLVAAVALVPPVALRLRGPFDRLRHPSRRTRWVVAVAVWLISAAYFRYSAFLAHRDLFPVFHDEFMFLLQARMLAHGRLWMPQHPLAEFFDSFFIFVKPVYAASYFPGCALLYVPGIWLGAAPWVTAAAVTGLAISFLYLVMTEIMDGLAGILAVLLALSLEWLRIFAVMTMSQTAMLMLYLAAVWVYLVWRKRSYAGRRAWVWVMASGILWGWAGITRPLDALCLLTPLAAAMFWNLRRGPWRRIGATIAIITAGVLPFAALQLVLDKGVTGRWLSAPVALYEHENLPGLELAFPPHAPAAESPSPLPQVRDYYRVMPAETIRMHAHDGFWRTWIGERLRPAADVSLPAHLLYVLLPLGLLGLRRPAAGAIFAGLLIYPLVYVLRPQYLSHYGLVIAPGFILLILLAGEVLRRRFAAAGPAFALSIAALAIGLTPLLGNNLDWFMRSPNLHQINAQLAHLPITPAVVLFHYEPHSVSVHEEPVYNIDTPWPDDAQIVRAHDLGLEKNRRIFNYYAGREPSRFFYRYDRRSNQLTPLGWAKDLARSN